MPRLSRRQKFHGRGGEIFDLDPVCRSAWPILRTKTLGYDAVATELACIVKCDAALDAKVPVDLPIEGNRRGARLGISLSNCSAAKIKI
jgi:hypothetical protein